MKRLLWPAVATLLLLVGCHPWGGPFGHHNMRSIGDHAVSELQHQLSLNNDQDQKLKVVVATIGTYVENRAQVAVSDAPQWDALVSAPTVDQKQMRALMDSRQAQDSIDRAAFLDQLVPQIAAFLDSLTPAQKAKLVTLHGKLIDHIKSAR